MAVTQKEIAEVLGVSHATVSQVLHGSRRSRISPQKQQEIRELARSMGYRPRALTTHTVGLVLPIDELRLLGESDFLVRVEAALSRSGYKLVLLEYKNDPHHMRELLNSKTVDGAILSRWYDGALDAVLGPDLPWVLTSTEVADELRSDRITVDLDETMRGIVQEIVRLGHRRIALTTGCLSIDFHSQLWDSLRTACREFAGNEADCSVFAGLDENLETGLLSAFRCDDAPTALVAGSPEKAIIAINFLCRQGLRVPQDVSVVSFFDLPLFKALRPWLTATNAMGVAVAEAAVERLLGRISDPEAPVVEHRIPGALIMRDSLSRVRK